MKLYIYLAWALLVPYLLSSCSTTEWETPRQLHELTVDISLTDFACEQTRATSPTSGTLYIDVGGTLTTATYDASTQKWMLALQDDLPQGTTSCTVWYISTMGSVSDGWGTLNIENSRVYRTTTATFVNTTETMKLTAQLVPQTSCLRFKGSVGATFTVSGLKYLTRFSPTTFEVQSGNIPGNYSFAVSSSGYTPYVYVLPTDTPPQLTITYDGFTYTRTFTSTVLRAGHMGYITLPTRTSHDGWTTNEQTNVNITGNGFSNESDWNQKDPDPTVNTNITGDGFGTDEDWNQLVYNGHKYVDLGLPSGTLWATCNVGASNPEDYGDYFAWGETEPKSTYDWSTYKWCNGSSSTMTKYCTSSSNGTVDNKTELDPTDDAATVNWGSGWRMPSKEQIDELYNSSYTTTTWTTQNGVNGRKVTSKTNGNSLFLPAAGSRNGSWLNDAGSYAYYWSRMLYSYTSNGAYYLCISSNSIGTYHGYYRYYGFSVRPVLVSQN